MLFPVFVFGNVIRCHCFHIQSSPSRLSNTELPKSRNAVGPHGSTLSICACCQCARRNSCVPNPLQPHLLGRLHSSETGTIREILVLTGAGCVTQWGLERLSSFSMVVYLTHVKIWIWTWSGSDCRTQLPNECLPLVHLSICLWHVMQLCLVCVKSYLLKYTLSTKTSWDIAWCQRIIPASN